MGLLEDSLLEELTVKGFVKMLRSGKITHMIRHEESQESWCYCDACGSIIPRSFEIIKIRYHDPQQMKWEEIGFCPGCEDTDL